MDKIFVEVPSQIGSAENVQMYQGDFGVAAIILSYKLVCQESNYYGPDCDILCIPHDDSNGHYSCNQFTGSIECLPGFEDPGTNCVCAIGDIQCLNPTTSTINIPTTYVTSINRIIQPQSSSATYGTSVILSPTSIIQSSTSTTTTTISRPIQSPISVMQSSTSTIVSSIVTGTTLSGVTITSEATMSSGTAMSSGTTMSSASNNEIVVVSTTSSSSSGNIESTMNDKKGMCVCYKHTDTHTHTQISEVIHHFCFIQVVQTKMKWVPLLVVLLVHFWLC